MGICRVLTLDGGGAKGFYTIGVLREVEASAGKPLCELFDLIFGTSTGSIIASLLALGNSVDEIHDLYREHVVKIMGARLKSGRSAALRDLADTVFGPATFSDTRTALGVVAARWQTERPMIFKSTADLAHGRKASFTPGFGVRISDAVQASCSAFPFFNRKFVTTSSGDQVELVDGGYCANNPTLYAIADAVNALGHRTDELRVLSVGVGDYPEPKHPPVRAFIQKWPTVQLLQKTLNINTESMDQLRAVLFKDVRTVRISDTFKRPEMATDLLEKDVNKLSLLHQSGRDSFGRLETEIAELLELGEQ